MKRPTTLVATLLVTMLSLSLSFTFTSISTARAASIFASLPNGYAFAGNVVVPGGSTSAGSGPVAPAWLGCILDATFTGLNVAGHAISASPGPNTTIHIANLGDVVLNEQGNGPSNGPVSTYAGINMIDLHVTNANTLGLPLGTRILIATVNS